MSNCCKKKDNADTPGILRDETKQSVSVRSCVTLLKIYKQYISPLFPPSCRYTPTCSEYAIDAVRRRGVIHGLFLAVFRLFRCHPFARGGYDPVE